MCVTPINYSDAKWQLKIRQLLTINVFLRCALLIRSPSVIFKMCTFSRWCLSLPPYLSPQLSPQRLPICSLCIRYSTDSQPPCPPLIRTVLGHLSEDVYPGCKYVRGNIILVLPYLSSVWSINISIAKWGWVREKKNECTGCETESEILRTKVKEGWGETEKH